MQHCTELHGAASRLEGGVSKAEKNLWGWYEHYSIVIRFGAEKISILKKDYIPVMNQDKKFGVYLPIRKNYLSNIVAQYRLFLNCTVFDYYRLQSEIRFV